MPWKRKPPRWYQEYRLSWIKESLEIFGGLRREHIMKKFGVSVAQASLDLRLFQERWPGVAQYDLSAKIYKLRGNCEVLSEELEAHDCSQ